MAQLFTDLEESDLWKRERKNIISHNSIIAMNMSKKRGIWSGKDYNE